MSELFFKRTNRVAVFDMDGTLVDSIGDIAGAADRMRQTYGLTPLPIAAVKQMVGCGARTLVERVLSDVPDHGIDIDEALHRYRAEYDACLTGKTRLYPGVMEGLERLRSLGFLLAVYTNKPGSSTHRILADLHAETFFSVIIGSGDGFPLKPAPDALFHILHKTGSVPERSWMVGDNWTDIDAGLAAGMLTAYCAYGYGHPETHAPTTKVDGFSGFVKHIFGAADETE